jgi:transglutaminase-like putative cysteine protease
VTEATLLRGSVVAAAGAGLLSLGIQGQVRPIAAFGALLLLLVAGAAPLLLPDGRAAVLRRRVAKSFVLGGCLIGALWLLAVRALTGFGDTSGLLHQVGTTVSLSLAIVLAAQLACADSRRELRVVLVASLLCGLVALGTAEGGGAQDLLSGLGFVLVLGWTAALLSLWLLQRAKQREAATFVHLGRVLGDGRHLGALVILSTLIGVAALLLLPHPDGWHPPGLDGRASGPGSPLQKSGNGDYQAAPRSPENYFRGAMDLNSRGKLSSTRLVSVPADSPELWAASVLYAYDGTFWGPQQFPVNRTFQVPKDSAGDYDLRPGAAPGAAPAVAARSDVVRTLVPGAFLPVISPGQAVAMQFDGRVFRPLGSTAEPIAPSAKGSSYVVRSNQDITDAVTKEDTDLPSSLPTRVRDLAQSITRSAGTTEDKVAAIEAYLHAHEVYRLDSPAPGLGRDAVDDFLFVSHEGFCEHFASAEAVLLRSIGVPARLVTGFTNGEDEGTRRVFRGTDAHAWVEVNVGGQHWVFTDPTAGATIAPPHRSRLQSAGSVVAAHWQLGAGSAALLAGIVVLTVSRVRRVLVRRTRRQELASPPGDQVLAAFARFETALERLRLGRTLDSSIHELHVSLVAHWPGGLPEPDETREAMVVVERVLYDAVPTPESTVRAAISTLDQLADLAGAF